MMTPNRTSRNRRAPTTCTPRMSPKSQKECELAIFRLHLETLTTCRFFSRSLTRAFPIYDTGDLDSYCLQL